MSEKTKDFKPIEADYAERLKDHFRLQKLLHEFDAEITDIGPGYAEITLPYHMRLTQQNGYLHAGVVSTLADSAGGYAGATLISRDSNLLAVEFKVNFIAPAKGDRIVARGHVIKNGRTLIITRVDVFACEGTEEKLCSIMQQTLIRLEGKSFSS